MFQRLSRNDFKGCRFACRNDYKHKSLFGTHFTALKELSEIEQSTADFIDSIGAESDSIAESKKSFIKSNELVIRYLEKIQLTDGYNSQIIDFFCIRIHAKGGDGMADEIESISSAELSEMWADNSTENS